MESDLTFWTDNPKAISLLGSHKRDCAIIRQLAQVKKTFIMYIFVDGTLCHKYIPKDMIFNFVGFASIELTAPL